MVLGDEQHKINIKIDDENIEQVTEFKYLGVDIHCNGYQEIEINNRVDKAMKIFHAMGQSFINKKEISRKTKINVFKTIYRPILTFGCETWILNKQQKSKIQAVEMRYLRRTKGVTRYDRIRNTDIREELEIESTLEFIERRQLSWWGHLQRMDNKRPVKKIWEAKVQKQKKRGRPRKTWDGVVNEILLKRGTTWEEARRTSKNKKEWTKLVYS